MLTPASHTDPALLTPDRIAWILCDLGKTIVDFDFSTTVPRLRAFLAAAPWKAPRGVPSAEDLHTFAFKPQPDTGRSRALAVERGDLTFAGLVDALNAAFGTTLVEDDVVGAWSEIFGALHPATLDAMRRAQSRGVRVAVCSNTNAQHWTYIWRHYDAVRTVRWDALFLSYELGRIKIDAEFFPRLLARTGAPPERHLFLDDLEDNLASAARCGIATMLYAGRLSSCPLWD